MSDVQRQIPPRDINQEEHQRFEKAIEGLEKEAKELFQQTVEARKGQIEDLARWQEVQDAKQSDFQKAVFDKIDGLKTSLENESYMKNLLLNRIKELKVTIDYWRKKQEMTDQRSVETAARLGLVQEEFRRFDFKRMEAGVDHANAEIRGLDKRVKSLEDVPTTQLRSAETKRQDRRRAVLMLLIGAAVTVSVWLTEKGIEKFLAARPVESTEQEAPK